MFLKYGTYSHALNEAEVVIEREPASGGGGGTVALLKERWSISGELRGANQAAITAAINALQDAYSVNGQNLSLCFDDGSATAHVLTSNGTADGVQVKRLSFPQGKGPEYSTHRTYQIVIEADIPVNEDQGAGTDSGSGSGGGGSGSEAATAEFSETLSFTGGGPRYKYLIVLNGPPQLQMVNQQTPYKVVQQGQAKGLFFRPFPPPPIWPAAEHVDQRQISKVGKKGISWTYTFESAAPLSGEPRYFNE